VAEGFAQAPGQLLVVVSLPPAVAVDIKDGKAALQNRPSPVPGHPGEDGGHQDSGDDDYREPGRDLRCPSRPGLVQRVQQQLEQVIQAEAVLGEITGVELARRYPAGRDADEPEDHRQRHVDPDPGGGAACASDPRPTREVSVISAATTAARAAADTSHSHAGTIMDHIPGRRLAGQRQKSQADPHRDPHSSSAGRRRMPRVQVKMIWPPAARA
jgi:hypothetical protein